jgi:curved DNA-binding protein CbpA
LTSGSEPDPYTVLNVPRTATPSEIRAAYHALVAKYHPDLHQGNPLEELASARLAEINRAYELLSDTARRGAYDAGDPGPRRAAPAPARKGRGLVLVIAALLVVPLAFRAGAVVLRGLVALARGLFEASASVPGGRPTAVAVLALTILAVTLRRRRRP